MKKALLMLAAVAVLAVPSVSFAESFTATVKSVKLTGSVINDQTLKIVKKSATLAAGQDETGNLSVDITSNVPDGSISGDLTLADYNFAFHFEGALLAPTPGTTLTGHVGGNGSFTINNSFGDPEDNTFDASVYVKAAMKKDLDGNMTSGVLTLTVYPCNAVNSFAGGTVSFDMSIPSIKLVQP